MAIATIGRSRTDDQIGPEYASCERVRPVTASIGQIRRACASISKTDGGNYVGWAAEPRG
jgi:hypothetical protein